MKRGIFYSVMVLALVLAVVIPMATPAIAAYANGGVTPNTIMNDGSHQADFNWDVGDWDGVADHYAFYLRAFGSLTPIYIQYSDGAGTDDFPGVTVPLQNIGGTVGAANVSFQQPEYPDPHVWTVPSGFTPGRYQAVVHLYLLGDTLPVAEAVITFDIVSVDIELTKYVSVDDQSTWEDANQEPWPTTGVGDDVYFKFRVQNTSTVTLTGINLTDSAYDLSGITPSLPASLAANATYEGIIGPVAAETGLHTNTGNVTAYWEGNPVSDSDPANYYASEDTYRICGFKFLAGTTQGLTGWEIILEKSVVGAGWVEQDRATTDGSGKYCFEGLTTGDYRVSETPKPGWTQISPIPNEHLVTLPDGASDPAAGPFYNFENQPPPVGGDAYPVSRLALLVPWVALALVVFAAAGLLLRRRRTV